MIKVYGLPHSRSTRVLWTLEEIGEEYDYVPVDLGKLKAGGKSYLDINPAGKVPAIVDGDLILTESAAICTYLGDKFPESGLVPKYGTVERALYNKWCYFVLTELEQPLWTLAKHKFVLPRERRIPQIDETAKWEFQNAARVVHLGLGNKEFIVGDCFTAADILLAHTLLWTRAAKVDIEQAELWSYAERMLQRPGFQSAKQRGSVVT